MAFDLVVKTHGHKRSLDEGGDNTNSSNNNATTTPTNTVHVKKKRGRPKKDSNASSSNAGDTSSSTAARSSSRSRRGQNNNIQQLSNPHRTTTRKSSKTCQSEGIPEHLQCDICKLSKDPINNGGFRFSAGKENSMCQQPWDIQNCTTQKQRLNRQLIIDHRNLNPPPPPSAARAKTLSSPKKKPAKPVIKPLSPSKKGNRNSTSRTHTSTKSNMGSSIRKMGIGLFEEGATPTVPTTAKSVTRQINTTHAVISAPRRELTQTTSDSSPNLPSKSLFSVEGAAASSAAVNTAPPSVLDTRVDGSTNTASLTAAASSTNIPQAASQSNINNTTLALSVPTIIDCMGVSNGSTPEILAFVGKAMSNTGNQLLDLSRGGDNAGLQTFVSSLFCATDNASINLPFGGMVAKKIGTGFGIYASDCTGVATSVTASTRVPRCDKCQSKESSGRKFLSRQHQPVFKPPGQRTNLRFIVSDPRTATYVIKDLRGQLAAEKEKTAELLVKLGLDNNGVELEGKAATSMMELMEMLNTKITQELQDEDELVMWKTHMKHLMDFYRKGGNKYRMRYDPDYVEWAIVFLARNSIRTYKEVAKVMILPDISYLHRIIAQRVSRSGSRAFGLCTLTMHTVMKRAEANGWDDNARIMWLALDSMSVAMGVQWDYRRGLLVGQCNEHAFSPVSNKFQKAADKLKQIQIDETNETIDTGQNTSTVDNAKLAREHCVLTATSIKGDLKTSEIFASTNVENTSAAVVHSMTFNVVNNMPSYGLQPGGISVDAAGPNWKAFLMSTTHSASDFLPLLLMESYPEIDFNIKHMIMTPVGLPFIFCADNMHLTKAIVTAMDLSSKLSSKRDIRYNNCPVNLRMVEISYRATGGGTNQLQPTKLTDSMLIRDARTKIWIAVHLLLYYQVLLP